MSYIDTIIFDSGGHTGKTYYFRIVEEDTGKAWDTSQKALSLTASWENTAIAMTEQGTTGQFPVVIPDELPAGKYNIVVYEQAGSAPSNTDDIVEKYLRQKGSIFGF